MINGLYKSIAAIFIFIVCGFIVAGSAFATDYIIIDLGTLGGSDSTASGINDSGQVVGMAYTSGNSAGHAFLYNGGVMTDLGILGGESSGALCINKSGQIAGWSNTSIIGGDSVYDSHAFLYNGIMSDLGTLGGKTSQANGINSSGQIVGQSQPSSGNNHAFLYSSGVMTDLGTLGGDESSANAINDSGQITGYSWTRRNASSHAFLYYGSSMTDIGTLGGSGSVGYAINKSGQIAGAANITGDSASHAFLYSAGVMHDIGTLGGSYSEARGINDAGQIVGFSYITGDSELHAFLYSNGYMLDLNNLIPQGTGWKLTDAYAINNSGQIAGYGIINGQHHAFLMTPACTYSIDTTGSVFDSAAGSDSIQLVSQSGCPWTISNSMNWVTIASGTSGSGSSTINYTIAANTGTSSRSGNFSVAGMNYSVTQAGSAGAGTKGYTFCSNENQHCSFSGSLSVAFGSNGKFAYKTLSNGADCTTGIFGDPNPGAIKACFTKGANCSYTLSPTAKTFSYNSDTGSVTVTASSTNCTWSTASNASWITVTSGSSKTGSGTVTFSIAANTGSGSRTGTITIAGQTFTVTQAGLPQYTLTVSKANTGTGIISSSDGNINCGSTCSSVYNSGTTATLTASADTSSAFAGWGGNVCSGVGTCSVLMNANTTVTASFVLCSFGISPSSISFTYSGGSGNATVSAASNGCSWTSTSNASWITVTSGSSGTGNGNVTYSVAANTSTSSRTGTITIAGQTLTVTQSGIPQYALNISKSGTGAGTITSADNTVSCGSTCSSIYNSGSSITLTATPDAGSTFTGWSGACSGTGTCTISMNANISVSAIFDKISPIQLTITSPADGTTINGPAVTVFGTFSNSSGNDTTVTVNGLAAVVYGNQFFANKVSLSEGMNSVTVLASDAAGNSSSIKYYVNALTTGNYITLTPTQDSGMAPLNIALSIGGAFVVSNPAMNVTGPASVATLPGDTGANAIGYAYNLTDNGIYYFTVQAVGPNGEIFKDTIAIAVTTADLMDKLFRNKWTLRTNSLKSGDTNAALSQIGSASKSNYQQMFNALGSQLPAITETETGFNLVSINNGAGRYELVTMENGQTYSYNVLFMPDIDGTWMIQAY